MDSAPPKVAYAGERLPATIKAVPPRKDDPKKDDPKKDDPSKEDGKKKDGTGDGKKKKIGSGPNGGG